MSLEGFFLVNQAMDFALLAAAARSAGVFRLRRVLPASGLAALYAVLAQWSPMAALRSPAAQAALLALLARLVSGASPPKLKINAALSLVVALGFAGTAVRLLTGTGLKPATIPAGMLASGVCCAQLTARREVLASRPVEIRIVSEGRSVRLSAIIDTGNRLVEPLSGQPVLIAHEAALIGLLPKRGYREVAYGALGGAGTLRCFKPERVYISRGARDRRMPEAWVALFPAALPGRVQALAPAAFSLC